MDEQEEGPVASANASRAVSDGIHSSPPDNSAAATNGKARTSFSAKGKQADDLFTPAGIEYVALGDDPATPPIPEIEALKLPRKGMFLVRCPVCKRGPEHWITVSRTNRLTIWLCDETGRFTISRQR